MAAFDKTSGAQTPSSCYKCGKLLGTVAPFAGIVRTAGIPEDNESWCYVCGACGRTTCYDCSDNTLECACGHTQWVDSIIMKDRERVDADQDKAIDLLKKAFFLVEQGNHGQSIELLEQAIGIDPKCGDAYNELAFIHGRVMGNLDRAEEYARQAVECDPNNPKFHNTINGIQVARAKSLGTRREVRERTMGRLQEIQSIILKDPSYPPAYLMKAVTLALGGESQENWETEIRRAEQLYLQDKVSAVGIRIGKAQINSIISRNRQECLEMSRYWNRLPK